MLLSLCIHIKLENERTVSSLLMTHRLHVEGCSDHYAGQILLL